VLVVIGGEYKMAVSQVSSIEKLDFGRFAAEVDTLRQSQEVFVETRQSNAYQLPEHQIILGRKGVGKTALQLEFERNYNSKYKFFLPIDAESIRFQKLIDNYQTLKEEAGSALEFRKSITNIWEHAIMSSCMLQVVGKINTLVGPGAVIHAYLRREELLKKRIYDLLIDMLERLLQLLMGKSGKTTGELIRLVDDFPLDNTEYKDACSALQEVLGKSGGVLVTFDRIDRYFETVPQPYKRDEFERVALRHFLVGLVQAVYNISTAGFSEKIQFKVFLPEDKYGAIRSRDLDKIKEFIFRIQWTPDELKEVIARRISHSLNLRNKDGSLCISKEETWDRIFPRNVANQGVSGIPEDTADYLIRHTHFRPRDLQYHCAKVRELALSRVGSSASEVISESLVRNAVKEVTPDIVDNVFLEFEYEHPFLRELLDEFREIPNIISYTERFFPMVDRFRRKHNIGSSSDELIASLYRIGFVGGVRSRESGDEARFAGDPPPTRKVKGRTYSFYFGYIHPHFDIRHCESVALHSAFNEFLNLEINREIIVG
jgi:hypothetical protein